MTLNYRLGALGFLELPSLTGGGDFGFEDQQAALGWIKRNIAAFGGDPENITIGGEVGWRLVGVRASGRGGSRGLFNKAIIQSGACDSKPAAQAEAEGIEFAHKLGCADAASMVSCLREKPVADVLDAQAPYYLLTDGTPALPTHLLDGRERRRLCARAHHHRFDARRASLVLPVVGRLDRGAIRRLCPQELRPASGCGSEAISLAGGRRRDPAAVAYQIAAIGTDNGNLGAGAIEQGIGGCATTALAAIFAKNVPVHVYEFSPRSGPGWYTIAGYQWGAGHAAELTYLYPAA